MSASRFRITVVAMLFLWAVAWGGVRLFAAEGPPISPMPPLMAEPEATPVAPPLAEAEATPVPPPESDCLDLLESSGAAYDGCGGCGECSACVSYNDYGDYSVCEDCEDSSWYEEDCGDSCGLFWMRADYLLWWTRGARLPPLVTTSPIGTPPGLLGQPTTEVLFGDTMSHVGGRSSFRIRMGFWFDECQTAGVEADYFDLGQPTTSFSQLSSGVPVLARPFFDVVNQIESSQIIASPGSAVGDVTGEASDYFSSVGVRVRTNLFCFEPCDQPACYDCGDYASCGDACDYGACYNRNFRLDLIGGYRHYRLTSHLGIRENVTSTGPPNVTGTMFNVLDDFRTTNEFNGGELGMVAQLNRGCWSVELLAAMMMGNTHRIVTINGSTDITVPGFDTINYSGGLLALPTNIGTFRDDRFVIIPQFGVELGYQVSCRLRAILGYNFIYWANVARAGDQIDLNVNPTQIPPGTLAGEARPRFEFQNADFWAQGLNVGFEYRF